MCDLPEGQCPRSHTPRGEGRPLWSDTADSVGALADWEHLADVTLWDQPHVLQDQEHNLLLP